ncbi:MAG: OmpA family protein [Desulfobacteraceae bacterium]|nr:OmpA family protein [Desulfobacteraceae bacterium]
MRTESCFRPARMTVLWIVPVLILTFVCTAAMGADLPGSKDNPLLKRFAGSEIVGYDLKRFDEYELQTSTFKRYNLETTKREFAEPPLKLEGARTRIWYEARGEASSTELIRNYQNELKAQGFQILYDSTQDANATTWNNFLSPFGSIPIKTNRSAYIFFAANEKSIRVTSAKLERPQGDVYVSLIAVEWAGDDATYKARQGAYVAVDIIEVRPMTQNMVVVSADEMSKTIASSGRVALYGIFFDTNKADIKPESKPALDEIGILLKKEPNLKLHVVGHTDNVGGYEHNLSLSKRRADAVVAALTKGYGIAAGRLTPNGVAYLAPVAVNTTDEGRAKNRRVELVPQ